LIADDERVVRFYRAAQISATEMLPIDAVDRDAPTATPADPFLVDLPHR
jgi:hypothetical protein